MWGNKRKMGYVALIGLMAFGASACSSDAEVDERAAVDREMDLALEADAEPELRDVAQQDEVTETPPPAPPPPAAQPRPRPAPPPAPPPAPAAVDEPPADPPAPATITLTAVEGTSFRVELRDPISTKTNQVGDEFRAAVIQPITNGGQVVVPAGAMVYGRVTALQKSGGEGQEAVIKLAFDEVVVDGETYPLRASITDAEVETEGRLSTGDKVARGGAGAVVGGILGRVIGGNTRGAVIGAAVGAAAGTAVTLITEDVDAVLPAGSELGLRLDAPLRITTVDPLGG